MIIMLGIEDLAENIWNFFEDLDSKGYTVLILILLVGLFIYLLQR